MNTNDPNLKNDNNDKTIVFNNSNNIEKIDLDKTQLQQNTNNTNHVVNDDKTVIHSTSNSSEVKESENVDESNAKSKQTIENKGVSKSVLVAGISGAGLAGVVAGTVFSEEIKGAVEAISTNFSGNGDEIPEVTEEVSNDLASLTFSDSTGVYEVTLSDSIGDGNIDTFDFDAQLVDGTNVQFTASGSLMDQLFQNDQVQVANTDDYLANVFEVFEGFSPESLNSIDYQIQYGDTLSEIAASNNTSVAHLMELNPHLDDPNVIMAGDHLVIPTNDYTTNPYEGWNPEWSQSSDVYIAESDATFDTMDWNSFEDQPLDDYSGFLYTEDFQNYSSVDTYFDQSNDLASLDFFE
jgi:LysM repeat protein